MSESPSVTPSSISLISTTRASMEAEANISTLAMIFDFESTPNEDLARFSKKINETFIGSEDDIYGAECMVMPIGKSDFNKIECVSVHDPIYMEQTMD